MRERERFVRRFAIPICARGVRLEPVAVREQQLPPFEGRLDVLEHREPLLEMALCFVGAPERRRAQREYAIGGRLFVAIPQLTAMLEASRGLVIRLLRAAQQEEALGAPPPKLRDDVALGHTRERLRQHAVIVRERRVSMPLLELDAPEELLGEEENARGFAGTLVGLGLEEPLAR